MGDLLITEVMANPAEVSDSAGEWFEIINTTADDIDLNGIILLDNGSNQHTVVSDAALLLQSGAYFTFGRNGDSSINGGYQTDYTYSNFTLGNSSDAIILTTATTEIDRLLYSGSVFSQAGNSAELTPSGFALTASEFIFGLGDIGSPGASGSFFPAVDIIDSSFGEDSGAVNVPEPATSLLMLLGITGLIAGRWKSNVLS
ncbi:MAG: lamin tail domain-containing protein [Oceanicoccus sp.]